MLENNSQFEREFLNSSTTEISQAKEIRTALLKLDPRDISHHLPNLVETIKSASNEEIETLRFHIGVSFTKDLTPLDYRIDQVVIPEDRNHTRIRSLKTAVSRDHLYLSFQYPPDEYISSESLRGAMLSTVEQNVVYSNTPPSGTRSSKSLFAKFLDTISR